MIDNLIASVKRNLQVYKAAKDAWIADKKNDADIHDNYVNARDTLEMGAYEDETELLAAIERLQAENARLRNALRPFAEAARNLIVPDVVGYSCEHYGIVEKAQGKFLGISEIYVRDLRQAAAALADVETEGGKQ